MWFDFIARSKSVGVVSPSPAIGACLSRTRHRRSRIKQVTLAGAEPVLRVNHGREPLFEVGDGNANQGFRRVPRLFWPRSTIWPGLVLGLPPSHTRPRGPILSQLPKSPITMCSNTGYLPRLALQFAAGQHGRPGVGEGSKMLIACPTCEMCAHDNPMAQAPRATSVSQSPPPQHRAKPISGDRHNVRRLCHLHTLGLRDLRPLAPDHRRSYCLDPLGLDLPTADWSCRGRRTPWGPA